MPPLCSMLCIVCPVCLRYVFSGILCHLYVLCCALCVQFVFVMCCRATSQTSPWCLMETVEHDHNASPPATLYKEMIINVMAMFNWLT